MDEWQNSAYQIAQDRHGKKPPCCLADRLEELEAEIKELSLKDRAALARWIVKSIDELSEAEINALWVGEAERRLDESEQGLVTELAAEEVLRRARAAIS